MKKHIYTVLLVAVLVALFSGCSSKIGEFTIISTRNVSLDNPPVLIERSVSGSSMSTMLLGFKLFTPDLREAVNDALDDYEADFLTNVVIYERDWTILWLFGREGYVVKGDAWRNYSSKPIGFNDAIGRGTELAVITNDDHSSFRVIPKNMQDTRQVRALDGTLNP